MCERTLHVGANHFPPKRSRASTEQLISLHHIRDMCCVAGCGVGVGPATGGPGTSVVMRRDARKLKSTPGCNLSPGVCRKEAQRGAVHV